MSGARGEQLGHWEMAKQETIMTCCAHVLLLVAATLVFKHLILLRSICTVLYL